MATNNLMGLGNMASQAGNQYAMQATNPYAVGAYELGETSLIAGYTIREEVIRRIVDTEAREQWRGYSAGLKTERLDLPAWALRSAGLV